MVVVVSLALSRCLSWFISEFRILGCPEFFGCPEFLGVRNFWVSGIFGCDMTSSWSRDCWNAPRELFILECTYRVIYAEMHFILYSPNFFAQLTAVYILSMDKRSFIICASRFPC